MKSLALKMNNEKLVRISVEKEGRNIKNINISGDFFIHPENGICLLEEAITGQEIKSDCLKEALNKIVKENNLELIGISTDTIVYGIIEVGECYEK